MKSGMTVFVCAFREFIQRKYHSQIAIVSFICLLFALSTGCGGSSSIQPPPRETAPSNLRYPQSPLTATIGQAISPDVPTVSGTVTSYTIDPALPTGLALNASTGAISGTPTVTAPTATYTVTALNSVGSTTVGLQITVNDAPPANLAYPQSPLTATIGQAISPDVPTVSGTVTSYTIDPALPTGLALNASTGAISGTPTVTAPTATYTVTALNSVGSTTAALQITVNDGPPANLVYPQTTITAAVGQAITSDTPTVIGTVAAYTVGPPLPPGMRLENASGVIHGTPTTVTPTAAYVVTATNSFGSTTASVRITVNAAAPANLIYPRKTIVATQGRRITPDIPTIATTVANYTIDPPLPAGLNLDGLTGVISGTPTVEAPSQPYVITASNITGTTTASVTISVARTMRTLLYLGHEHQIKTIRAHASRLLSLDWHGFWTLWDFDSGTAVADGDEGRDLDMAGATLAIAIVNGLELRSASDGHVLSTIIVPDLNSPDTAVASKLWWQLASDGSYVCVGSKSGLFVWDPNGVLMATRAGDYSNARSFSAPGEVRVALGPVGGNVVETISVADGTSSVGPPFSGQFFSWFSDGEHFFTNLSDTVWVYSKAGVQQDILAVPAAGRLAGQGSWFWSYTSPQTLSIFRIGDTSPTVQYGFSNWAPLFASASTVGVITDTGISIIDLSGSIPLKVDYAAPTTSESLYAAASSSQWAVGNLYGVDQGVLIDGASLASQLRSFGLGKASIAGSSNRIVVATASGTIFSFDPAITSPEMTIAFPAAKVALSADGTVLAASSGAKADKTLKVFSLPAGTVISSFPFAYPGGTNLFDFSLSASGGALGQVTGDFVSSTWTYQRQVLPVAGGSPSWTDTGGTNNTPIEISPDGTLVAVSKSEYWWDSLALYSPLSTTRIFKNGALVAAVSGYAVGWLDDGRLLVNTYVTSPCAGMCGGDFGYDHATIYGPDGNALSTPPIPEILQFQTITPELLYSVSGNLTVSLTTGEILWKSPYPSQAIGGVAGCYVVFDAERHVYAEPY